LKLYIGRDRIRNSGDLIELVPSLGRICSVEVFGCSEWLSRVIVVEAVGVYLAQASGVGASAGLGKITLERRVRVDFNLIWAIVGIKLFFSTEAVQIKYKAEAQD
jgi:hypothetical protein